MFDLVEVYVMGVSNDKLLRFVAMAYFEVIPHPFLICKRIYNTYQILFQFKFTVYRTYSFSSPFYLSLPFR